jgi:hypothetical protein
MGVKAMGYCYYHEQDLGRVIDATGSGLLMGFDSANGDDGEALLVANKVVEAMTRQGFEIKWNGAIEQRIEVLNVCWQKVPDAQSWDGERVMRALANAGEKKPFWKLW